MATEITDERDARLEYERASHREQQTVQSQLPLFQQCSIHANIATLDQYALPAQRDILASSFTQTPLSVCIVVVTNILQKYTPLITT